MTYTYADGKSDRFLTSYQGVRGADIRAIGTTIHDATPLSQIHSDFVRAADDANSNSVDNTLDFLEAIDFIHRPSDRTLEPIDKQPFANEPFEVRALHHIKQQKPPQDHLARIQTAVAEADTRFYDKAELKEDLERDHHEFPFDWTIEKVEAWYNLTAPLGLISIRNNQKILSSPTPRLVYDLIELFESTEDSTNIRDAFDWIEENFFSCYASRGGYPRVHKGLSDTLKTMIENGVLELVTVSDATKEIEVPATKANRVSQFVLTDRPRTPAYRYPLRTEEAVGQ